MLFKYVRVLFFTVYNICKWYLRDCRQGLLEGRCLQSAISVALYISFSPVSPQTYFLITFDSYESSSQSGLRVIRKNFSVV